MLECLTIVDIYFLEFVIRPSYSLQNHLLWNLISEESQYHGHLKYTAHILLGALVQ